MSAETLLTVGIALSRGGVRLTWNSRLDPEEDAEVVDAIGNALDALDGVEGVFFERYSAFILVAEHITTAEVVADLVEVAFRGDELEAALEDRFRDGIIVRRLPPTPEGEGDQPVEVAG